MIELPFFVVSDTHWFHDNIVKLCDRPPHHDQLMADRWEGTVGPSDRILHLGDLVHWRSENVRRFQREILPRLTGDKYLIIGNHDGLKRKVYQRWGFKIVDPFTQKINGRSVHFSHYPVSAIANMPYDVNVHGHTHNNVKVPKPGLVNVSVEVTDYAPQPVLEVIS